MNCENTQSIKAKLDHFLELVSIKASSSGRSLQDVGYILVSKTIPESSVLEAYACGIRDFGENRVQELLRKKASLPPDIRWHLIGHLQTNKVKQVIGEAVLIHSLDRLDLLREIEKHAARRKLTEVHCLIQVKTSYEESQFGVLPAEVADFARAISRDSCVKIHGLMTIAPHTEDAQVVRMAFRQLRELKENLILDCPQHDWKTLSMGMSGDYEIAIEEGSNLLRVGSVIFGARDYTK